jgi:hypothetical protein
MKKQAQAWWRQAASMVQAAANNTGQFERWVEQLASRDAQVAIPALWALQQAGPAVIPTLLAGLQHPHTRVRRGCVDIIDHGGYGADARCITALLPLLYDPVPHIRRAVWHTLFCERCQDTTKCEELTPVTLDRVALLIEVGLSDPNPKLQRQLAAELGAHVSDQRARQALEKIVGKGTDPALVATAQRALA